MQLIMSNILINVFRRKRKLMFYRLIIRRTPLKQGGGFCFPLGLHNPGFVDIFYTLCIFGCRSVSLYRRSLAAFRVNENYAYSRDHSSARGHLAINVASRCNIWPYVMNGRPTNEYLTVRLAPLMGHAPRHMFRSCLGHR